MSQDNPLNLLNYIFENTKYWLNFSELKNAAIITFNTAITIGIMTFLAGSNDFSKFILYYIVFVCIMMTISSIISILSFFPKLKLKIISGKWGSEENGNVFFYGDTAKMSVETFRSRIHEIVDLSGLDEKLTFDLCQQIVVVSRIAVKKYSLFMVALWFSLSAIITPIGVLLMYWLLIDEAF